MKKYFLPLLLFALLTACAATPSNATFPTPTLIETNPQLTPAAPTTGDKPPSPTQSASCRPSASLLDSLRAALPYEQAALAPLAYGGETSLMVWFASPALDTVSPNQAETSAISLAVQAAKAMLAASACLEEYDSLSFSVTDSSYWLWFSGSIRVADIPELTQETSGGGTDEDQGGGIQSAAPTSGGGTCTWADAAGQLIRKFYTPENLTAFYYTRQFSGSHAYAHWIVTTAPDADQALEIMQSMAAELACLAPVPAGLSATLTGPEGTLLATAYLPLNANGSPNAEQFSYTLLE